MALHFILDGYNIIKQTPVLADKSLDEGRVALVRLIVNKKLAGSIRNKVTIVFDGKPGLAGSELKGAVGIIFSYNETADQRIKKLVEGRANRKEIVVVTNDREIRYYVRSLGAGILKVEEFLGKSPGIQTALKAGKKKAQSGQDSAGKQISHTLESKINSELREIWLKKKQ